MKNILGEELEPFTIQKKICKYCQSEINEYAKVCPVCHRTLNFSLGRVFTVLIAIILLFFGIPFLYTMLTPSSIYDYTDYSQDVSQYITLDEFNTIESNMTYEEVKSIVGSEGTVVSQSELDDSNYIIYSWYGTDNISNANCSFINDKLVNKTQMGLR